MKRILKIILGLTLCLFAFTVYAQDLDLNAGDYEGKYKSGLRNGKGIMKWKDGSLYTGQWKTGNIHGQGTFRYKDGSQYRGEWRNGKRSGIGTIIWADGAMYKGEFINDNIEGSGKMTFSDGSSHDGQWKNNSAEGYGVHIWESGTEYSGTWKNNLRQGNGICIYHDGRIEQGTWKNDEYIPCECKAIPTVSEAFEQANAVFVGEVQSVEKGEGYDVVVFKAEQFWKGKLRYSRRVALIAKYSSCDLIFYPNDKYLIYAKETQEESVYYADACSRSNYFKEIPADIDFLDKNAPCKNNADDFKASNISTEEDFVCGCDGQTYLNANIALANRILKWKVGNCDTYKTKKEKN